jgi:hypothetical protein
MAQMKIVDFSTAATQQRALGDYDIEEEAPPITHMGPLNSIRGDKVLPTEDNLTVAIANGSQSAHKFTTWSVLLQTAKDTNADIMIISEPGRKATEQAIRWGTHLIEPRETATRDRR